MPKMLISITGITNFSTWFCVRCNNFYPEGGGILSSDDFAEKYRDNEKVLIRFL